MKFTEPAQVIDKDSIFVPIGWDSPAKMSVISEGKIQSKLKVRRQPY